MNYGVVYKFKSNNKINGSLFYCFEYFKFLRKYVDAKFYIVGIGPEDLQLVVNIFNNKYNTTIDNIVPCSITDLYQLQLDKTVVLDIGTFYDCKEFLTNDIHCFSNSQHDLFRYRNDRTVTYYGSYDYQRYDVFSYLKLNFEIFKPLTAVGYGVFVSGVLGVVGDILEIRKRFQKPVVFKKHDTGVGNLFDTIDSVHYIHTSLDTNNRIIPEAFYYGKSISMEDHLYKGIDSVKLRYDDIQVNGLVNYTLTDQDAIVQAVLADE